MKNQLKAIRLCLAITVIISSLYCYKSDTIATHSEYDRIMLDRINEYRKANGVSPLEYNVNLVRIADLRINELPVNFDHERPNGSSYKTTYTELGLNTKYEQGSENIAWMHCDWDFSDESGEEYVEHIFEAYIDSESHRENILNPYWEYYGGAFLTNHNGNCYQIQVFAK